MSASRNIGILHPGNMGVSVAASARNGGNTVYWASEGRSAATRERAEAQGLVDAGTLAALCGRCEVILCVCPPHAAEDVARDVAAQGFAGLYLDGNAIAPERARRIGEIVEDAGARFVDGGIIGGPAWSPNSTWLYLAGPEAQAMADCFSGGPLGAVVIGDQPGSASALKMCYAAYTKGSTALICAVVAAAEVLGVRDDLEHQWARNGSTFAEDTRQRVRGVTAKAWRFHGEMDEIAATFAGAGQPSGFHEAAAEVYRRIARFKDAPETPAFDDVLAALLGPPSDE